MKVKKLLELQALIEERQIPCDMTDNDFDFIYWSKSQGQWISILDMDLVHVVRALSSASSSEDIKDTTNKSFKTQEWKDIRIKEINAMGYECDDSHPCFDEVMAIYESDAETYEEFKQKQKEVA